MRYERVPMDIKTFKVILQTGLTMSFADHENDTVALQSLASCHLTARLNKYPPVYFFADIKGTDYILVKNDNDEEIEVFSVSYDSTQEVSQHIEALMHLRGITACEWYVLSQARLWEAEDDYYSILSLYGMADVIEGADQECTDVSIWAEHHYHPSYQKPIENDYLTDWMGEKLIYATVADAQEEINLRISSSYILKPSEISRPTYIITFQ